MFYTLLFGALVAGLIWVGIIGPYISYRHFKAQSRVACMPFAPFVGNYFFFRKHARVSYPEVSNILSTRFGDIVYSWLPGLGPRISFDSVEAAKDMLITYSEKFKKSKQLRVVLTPLLGQGLLLSDGDLHKRQRKLMTPAFHHTALKNMIPDIATCFATSVQHWLDITKSKGTHELEMHEEISNATLSILGRAVFGGSLDNANIYDDLRELLNATSAFSITAILPIIRDLPLSGKRRAAAFRARIDAYVMGLIEEERAKGKDITTGDSHILPMLVRAHDEDGIMSDQLVKDEAITFLLAGHETTAQLLSWTMVVLAKHPEWKQRVVEEIDTKLQDRQPTYDDLSDLPILNAVINETLRVYPPACMVARVSENETVFIDGVNVRPNTMIIVNLYKIHHNPKYWDDPETFNPNRWLTTKPLSHPMAFLPFSAGRRDCIGRNFALLEARIILIMMIQQLQFDLLDTYVHLPLFFITLRPSKGIPMRIQPRIRTPSSS